MRESTFLHMRFRKPLRSNPLGELVACRRSGTIVDYQDRFLALLTHAGPLTESQQVQLFIVGLAQHISIDVQLQGPQSLEITVSLAHAYERRDMVTTPAHPHCVLDTRPRRPHAVPFPPWHPC